MSKVNENFVVGVDLGGTNTVIGIIDRRGTIMGQSLFRTAEFALIDDYADKLAEEIVKLLEQYDCVGKVQGIGIGAPSVNHLAGTIENPAALPWKGIIPLADMIRERTGIWTGLTNDANAAAIGEATYGIAKGMQNFIEITLGTGVGSGIFVNGQMVYGHNGFAGELGHTIIRKNGRNCGCGRMGCLETYTSATGLVRTAKLKLTENPNRLTILRDKEPLTAKDIYEAARSGDSLSIEIFRETGEILGEAFADFVAFSDPEAIILFGGLTRAAEFLLPSIKLSMETHLLPNYRGKIKILCSSLPKSDAALLGASALGWTAP